MNDLQSKAQTRRGAGVVLVVLVGVCLGFVLSRNGGSGRMEDVFSILLMASSIAWMLIDGFQRRNRTLIAAGSGLIVILVGELAIATHPYFFSIATLSLCGVALASWLHDRRPGRSR